MQLHPFVLACCLLLDVPSSLLAQEPAPAPPAAALPQQPGLRPGSRTFSQQQLEELAAPIAIYPDALLSQVFMAATYPLEVVQAARFVQSNPGLTGSALDTALQDRDWDPSVKSMCGFPDLLQRMNDNLDWLRDLGDAFLGQQQELMDTVQRLRRTAYDAGTLRTTPQLQVQESPDHTVVIEPAGDVVYVPDYYPPAVFVGWGYPHWYYPRLYVAPPLGGPVFWFGAGVAWGGALWGRCEWGPHAHVIVDVPRRNHFVERTFHDPRPRLIAASRGPVAWSHDPSHRRGVNYRSPEVARRVHSEARPTAVPRERPGSFSGVRNPSFDRAGRERGSRSLQQIHAAPRPAPAVRPRSAPQPRGGQSQPTRPGGRGHERETP